MKLLSKKKDLETRAAELRAEIAALELRIPAGIDPERVVKRHIDLLHKYNEAKDATQMLIGRLAAVRQVTIREIHEEFDINHDD